MTKCNLERVGQFLPQAGSAAAGVSLLAGDEVVRVNGVALGGWRKEAISLVKSAHKTLALVVRRFLTKILRNSMRKNRFKGKNEEASSSSCPHSWHSSKLTEEDPEPAGRETAPVPVWQPMRETRPKEVPERNLHQLSGHFHSVAAMERLEVPAPPYRPGRPAPNTPSGGPEPASRDSGFSCFSSGSSSPPVPDALPPTRKATSTENIFFKGLLSEAGVGRQPRPEQHQHFQPRHQPPPLGNRGWERPRAPGDHPAPRVSFSGRAGMGPVWQVPPPAPPLRSDSFAATKVFPYSDGLLAHRRRSHCPGSEAEGIANDHRAFKPHGLAAPAGKVPEAASRKAAKDSLHPSAASGRHHDPPGKLFSLSSNDVRQGPPCSAYLLAAHQRQRSDDSPLWPRGCTAPKAQQQSVASYYRSLQDIPADTGGSKHTRLSAAAIKGGSETASACSPKSGVVKALQAPPQSQTTHVDDKEHGSLSPSGHQHPHLAASLDSSPPDNESRSLAPRRPLGGGSPVANRQPAAGAGGDPADDPDPGDGCSGKPCRRGDRYATALRHQVQQKRAQLQKSRSAVTLTCAQEDHEEDEEEPESWRSTAVHSSSNTYKDHLKEAQARVLQATSFQRRDLEPVGQAGEGGGGRPSRIGGRRRFPLAKRVHSFSEPDKMDQVGTAEGRPRSRPVFSKPVLKSSIPSPASDPRGEARASGGRPPPGEADAAGPVVGSGQEPASPDQQRLGTFAEYQATWSLQKKLAEVKAKGRYRSAENILDPGADIAAVCVHERSRSSPSADFYASEASVPWSDPGNSVCVKPPTCGQQGGPLDREGETESCSAGLQCGRPTHGSALPDHTPKMDPLPPGLQLPFEPPRLLTDRPPPAAVAVGEESPSRKENGTGEASPPARKVPEDAKREELARDIVGRDRALADILDQRGMRTTMDLMEGLFPQDQLLLQGGSSHPRRRGPPAAGPRLTAEDRWAPGVSRGRELIGSLAQKLAVLREARLSLQEDVEENEALGREVEAGVQRLCTPNQLDKFRMFVGDLDKVVSLLLSLSGRLARVENALGNGEEQDPPPAPEEKRTLTEKRALLLRQHEDARELKENLDRRERAVSRVMEAQLDARGLDDYRHFVKMKSALAIEQRTLEDKVKLGEEQLNGLLDSLPPEQRPAL
ncbi:hypothetical protein NHX12_014668 [Muraenolepis orangiensis]|uniref:Protein Shroom2 n=1 Tax=Muraenolepis orangiensis TaxID=630683 RepID=A0A9Q0I2B1_9TELE|nr:hypothetical protein NHX12_014668 [Muraenolepis orangiensis]